MTIRTYTPNQVSEILQISKATVYKMINEGSLKAKKINNRVYRIPMSELQWVNTGYDTDVLDMIKEDLKNLYTNGAADILKDARRNS